MQPNTQSPSLLKTGLILLAVAFACIASLLFVGDSICHSNIEQWIPYYPNATVVSTEHDFIRARGIGITTVTLASDDDEETVRQFYRDNNLALLDAQESRGLASTSWDVLTDGEGGSTIILYSECGR